MSGRFLRLSEVEDKIGYKKSWIYQAIKEGRFPEPVKIGPRARAFVEAEIDEWMQARIQESRQSKNSGISHSGNRAGV